MLSELKINNFKSLQNVEIQFSHKLNVLIGLNGSGKSTVLQGLDFITSLIKQGEAANWLTLRGWEKQDLYASFQGGKISYLIQFTLSFFENNRKYIWEGIYNVIKEKCTSENIECYEQDNTLNSRIELKDGIVQHTVGENSKLSTSIDLKQIDYKGSLLRIVKSTTEIIPYDIKQRILGILSIDLLSPDQMRRRSKAMPREGVGLGGEQLSIFLHRLPDDRKEHVKKVMKKFYPCFDSFETKTMRGGGIKLKVLEKYNSGVHTDIESRHLNDGMLRVLAIIAETLFAKQAVLIDEIEDGINPELLEKLVNYLLTDCPCQVIMTTHSPLLLNFLPDEDAEKIVQFVYKTDKGITQVVPFFDIPKMKKSLEMLGAGEVMLQYNMEDVAIMAEKIRDDSSK